MGRFYFIAAKTRFSEEALKLRDSSQAQQVATDLVDELVSLKVPGALTLSVLR